MSNTPGSALGSLGRQLVTRDLTRRAFFKNTGLAAGRIALASLMFPDLFRANAAPAWPTRSHPGLAGLPHFAPKARRLIYLFMNGAPSQINLWDYKPKMAELFDADLPESIRNGQRLTTMTSGQKRFPVAPSIYKFAPHGRCGTLVSELLPHTAQVVDDLAVIRTVYTEAINHDPASTFILTGNQIPGKPSIGAWLSYGLGSEAENLPAFVVMTPRWSAKRDAQALYQRLWGSGFLPSQHQGVALRANGDPVLYLTTRRAWMPPRAGPCSTASTSLIASPSSKAGTPRPRPGSPSTRWPFGCRPPSPN